MHKTKSNILLIYTGGTIGMIRDPETGSLRVFDFKNLLDKIPELEQLDCNINTFSFKNPIDSSNMNPNHWVQISDIIESHYHTFDGFVILHGSDTMSYTSSALSFMLENLSKPVIFTGSQLPIGDLRTDAKENLITSVQLASLKNEDKPVITEVCLYFEYKLYRANRTTKINAENFEAFASSNYPELAESGVHLKINYPYLWKPNVTHPLKVHKTLHTNIALIKLFPGITEVFLKTILNTPQLKGVILETFGAGNCMTETWFINLLKEAILKGIYIINITQCIGGSVNMGQYETSSQLKEIGIISGRDMTTESAICKLMHMLEGGFSYEEFKTNYEMSLRGELS
ncbi:asparaginase [Confluentibacter flavum]|uniref:asparaginase n=1 Tax=Confluentibacter flavum TaxID=1909700 RepID=A0A2N3HPE9_9FLAO|nr:type I asparaginase [Confluentibacter flavum]PKQ46825.1 L-asparaginase 1 [Confluentibacter flavum]